MTAWPGASGDHAALDALDVRLLRAVAGQPRAGFLELSRLTGVSRVTVQARLERMERAGVVTGYGPQLDLAAAGYPVRAVATLEISQGALDEVAAGLRDIPQVLEACATTGAGDVQCQLAAVSHEGLQDTLLRISRIPGVARSTSVVVLSQVVAPRFLELLEAEPRPEPVRTRR
jgi:DNA-binding Lrp family transcriptional regulator